ncbi:hypothetical protein DRH27_01895 [Candidatus Falkowbacteria bacterium]|nr:MAG: hypothetical protein DRH27_01895 [Candidatus Falkowbacteria bacterium]
MIQKKYLKYIILSALLCFFIFASVNLVMAQDTLLSDEKTECIKDGSCSINDMSNVILRVSEIILGVVGSLALLAFVVGGILLLVSGGNKNLIDRGKATLLGAVIGLAIVFLSYTIIGLVFTSMGIENAHWYESTWFNK